MQYKEGRNRQQIMLLPNSVEDYVSETNPVRVIDAFVDGLDMRKLGFEKAYPAETGRPAYDPRDLLKLYLYGYFNAIRSSRRLMRECGRNVEVMFLLGGLTPDFRTIADFRKRNASAIRKVFHAFVKVCNEMKLYQKQLLAIDGTKIRAVNAKANAYNEKTLREKLARIDEHMARYLAELDEADAEETDEPEYTREELQQKLKELRERKERYQSYRQELAETGETQKLTTDPEARVMHSKDGFHCYYNVQTAVDKGSHLIADYQVTNNCTDQGLLYTTVDGARKALEVEAIEAVADKGYESSKDIQRCVENGVVPQVALKYEGKEHLVHMKYEEAEITEEQKASAAPKDIKTCLHAGILPDCYENTGVTIEVQELIDENVSCFLLNDDNTVTCPMGCKLTQLRKRGANKIYGSKEACRNCTNRCTTAKDGKRVSFGPDTKLVPVKMYGKDAMRKAQKIPKGMAVSKTCHVLDTHSFNPERKVVLHIPYDKGKLHERMCHSEHPFGTVKWHMGAYYLLCKGKEKATAEMGLSFLAYNMKRAINMVGVKALVAAMG